MLTSVCNELILIVIYCLIKSGPLITNTDTSNKSTMPLFLCFCRDLKALIFSSVADANNMRGSIPSVITTSYHREKNKMLKRLERIKRGFGRDHGEEKRESKEESVCTCACMCVYVS